MDKSQLYIEWNWWQSWSLLFPSPQPAVCNASDWQPAVWMDDVQESWTMDPCETLSPKKQWNDKVSDISHSNIDGFF